MAKSNPLIPSIALRRSKMLRCSGPREGVVYEIGSWARGTFLKSVPGIGGTDEIWFDPTTQRFYVTGNNGTNTTRFFDVVDLNGNILQTINLPATISAHSITVDPLNGDVFVPLAGTTTLNPCPASFANPGCIEVFGPATAVPGPIVGAGLPGLLAACGALLALARRRRRQRTV
jgi:hypothetical protein